jgi:hypothetical protein
MPEICQKRNYKVNGMNFVEHIHYLITGQKPLRYVKHKIQAKCRECEYIGEYDYIPDGTLITRNCKKCNGLSDELLIINRDKE